MKLLCKHCDTEFEFDEQKVNITCPDCISKKNKYTIWNILSTGILIAVLLIVLFFSISRSRKCISECSPGKGKVIDTICYCKYDKDLIYKWGN